MGVTCFWFDTTATASNMSGSDLKEKTAKGLLWGGVNNGIQQVFGIVFGIVLARILDLSDYGLIGMLAIFTSISSAIINSGFSVALTNKKDITHKDYNAVFWFTVFAGLILYTILFFSAPLIADFYEKPILVDLSRVLFIGFVFSGIGTVPYTVLFKKLMVKQQAIIDIASLFIAGIIGVWMALKGYGYWALAFQTVIFVSLGAILRFVVAPWKPTFNFDFQPIREMLPFSIKIFFTNIFSQINNSVFSVILGKLYNEEEVAAYTQGYGWMTKANAVLSGMITSVAQPVLIEVQDNTERQRNVFRKMIRFGAFISFPLMLGLAFVGEEFIVITIGEKWLPSVPYLQVFCFWGAFSFLWNLYTYLIMSHGKSNIYMYGMITTGLLQLAVMAGLYPFGIFPMIIGYILIYYMGIGIWQYFASRLIGLRLRDMLKDIFPYLATTAGCFFVAWMVSQGIENIYFRFVSKVTVSVILYILIMKISKSVIFHESVSFLLKKKNKPE